MPSGPSKFNLQTVTVTAYPRVHVGLADVGGVSLRSYGGLGFSLRRPTTSLSVSKSKHLRLTGFELLDEQARSDVRKLLKRFATFMPDIQFSINLDRCPTQHIGLGTKTSLLLSLATAINTLCGLQLTQRDIQSITRRGGTSGIGLHSFFSGGIIWDGGHSPVRKTTHLRPSSAARRFHVPPLLARFLFPAEWRVALLLPCGKKYSGLAEESLFRAHTPVRDEEAYITMATLYHGVVPAFRIPDLKLLKTSLIKLHSVGFKKIELESQSVQTRRLLNKLHTLGIASGMSSMGPLIYSIFHYEDKRCFDNIRRACSTENAELICISSGSNRAALVQ